MSTPSEPPENRALQQALNWAGGQEALAASCRVSVDAVKRWVRLGRVPGTASRLISILMERPKIEKRLVG